MLRSIRRHRPRARRLLGAVLLVAANLATSLALAPAASTATPQAPPKADAVFTRVSGGSRYETAADIARQSFPGPVTTVVLVSGEGYADALAAAPVAGAYGAPILLTERHRLSDATASYLAEVDPSSVVIVGGVAGVSDAVVDDIAGATGATVYRLAGASRYETAAAVAAWLANGSTGGRVFLAAGESYADALSIAPVAYATTSPLLLAAGGIPEPTMLAIQDLQPSEIVIVGGTAHIPEEVELELASWAPSVTRLSGLNRSETSYEIATWAVAQHGFDATTLGLSRGDGYADALAASAAAGRSRSPLLLTIDSRSLGSGAGRWLAQRAGTITAVRLYGGSGAINTDVERAAFASSSTGRSSSKVLAKPTTTTVTADQVIGGLASSEIGGALRLAASVPEPTVGGHLVINAGGSHPDGLVARITDVAAEADGWTVTLAPATLDEAFSELEVAYQGLVLPEGQATAAQAKASNLRLAAPALDAFRCDADGVELDEPLDDTALIEVQFENMSIDYDLRFGAAHFQVNGEATIDTNIRAAAEVECEIDPAWASRHEIQITLPTAVPITLELTPMFEFELSAGGRMTLGARVWFSRGFDLSFSGWRWISSENVVPHGSAGGYVEATVFAGGDFSIKAYDIAGIYLKFGPEVVASAEVATDEVCAEVYVTGRVEMGARLDLWFRTFDAQAVGLNMGRWELARACSPIVDPDDDSPPEEFADTVLRRARDGASWYVDSSLVAHHIPNGGTFLCLTAWKGKRVVDASDALINAYDHGAEQSCQVDEARDRIIRRSSDGSAWYVDGDLVAHHIPNGGTFLCLTAWRGKQVIDNVTDDQVDALTHGEAQSCHVDEARDRIIRRSSDSAAWYVDGNLVAHHIPNGGTYLCLTAWKGKQVIDNVTDDQVDALTHGEAQGCQADEARSKIIRTSAGNAYWVDSSLVAHHIPNGGTYNCLYRVEGKQLINNVTDDHVNALPRGNDQTCRALLVGPDDTSYYVNSSDERYWVPTGGIFVCLRNRGVAEYRYSNWDIINLFVDRGRHASC